MDLSRRHLLAGLGSAPVLLSASAAMAQGIQPKRGGVLNVILNPEPPVLQIGINNQTPTLIQGTKITQGLLKFSPTLEPMPELAKSWTVSPDGLVYEFKLQENVKWHDGRPFTADDVIFSVMSFNKEVAPRLRGVIAGIAEATAPDPHTARFVLKQAFQPFLLCFDATALPMVAKHVYDGTDFRANPANARPIGTGPFKFVEWQRGNFVRMERFDGYWKPGQPYLDGILWRVIPDGQSRRLAIQSGQVQMTTATDIEPFDIPALRQAPNLDVVTKGWEYFSPLFWFEVNHRIKPFDDKRVRQAMSMALDRNFIVNRLWFGLGKAATGPISSTTRFHDPSVKLAPFDMNKAKALLDEAGVRANAQGVRGSFKYVIPPYGEIWNRMGEYFRQAMRQIGFEVTLESTDAGTWASRVANWDYEATSNVLYQFGDPTLGVERSYVTSNIQKILFTNTAGYSNPKVDELFAKARTSGNEAERKAAFSEVQKLLVEDMPLLWVVEVNYPTVTDKRLRNAVQLGTGNHASFDDVFLA
ncbi:ABC transporter substrate-binding protein [Roseomonas xinghualingensis]|uniref:ABC transporter substrate-binding protein n=1 Tax=Roseomonas xinghualingensis TaxID=2986475 RepID=UPI0021F1EAC7|nr:ABC transporter substrate-binding protein [Roseomonas sp. SXEYE001]MCV4206030.1 ABC transporter substrate-binding protein [Roseomonas sp. SXEYE001]